VILNNEEMKVLTSEILNTERIRNTRPLPRCIFSKTQIDEILKSKQEIAIQELLQLLVCSACNEKIWSDRNRICFSLLIHPLLGTVFNIFIELDVLDIGLGNF